VQMEGGRTRRKKWGRVELKQKSGVD
jgi:hypothetical protein